MSNLMSPTIFTSNRLWDKLVCGEIARILAQFRIRFIERSIDFEVALKPSLRQSTMDRRRRTCDRATWRRSKVTFCLLSRPQARGVRRLPAERHTRDDPLLNTGPPKSDLCRRKHTCTRLNFGSRRSVESARMVYRRQDKSWTVPVSNASWNENNKYIWK